MYKTILIKFIEIILRILKHLRLLFLNFFVIETSCMFIKKTGDKEQQKDCFCY